MSKKDEALKLAVEAAVEQYAKTGNGKVLDAAIRQIIANEALNKMAENARELGLDYEPAQQQEPVFWYRPCSNGMYEGPIHNSQIERVRKESGAWRPLYTSPQPSKPPTDEQITAGALALCKQMAEACGVDVRDQWQLYSDTFKEDAKAVLEAAHGITVEKK